MRERVVSFAPISGAGARIVILGSMPGTMSLSAGQYYAHPRNAFWKIMASVIDIKPHAEYEMRQAALQQARIAVWDVLRSCHRRGSLDADIETTSIETNDFDSFFDAHPLIEAVLFNGGAAERCYRKHVLPRQQHRSFRYARLPSTSPAHASLTFDAKMAAWHATIEIQMGSRHRRKLP